MLAVMHIVVSSLSCGAPQVTETPVVNPETSSVYCTDVTWGQTQIWSCGSSSSHEVCSRADEVLEGRVNHVVQVSDDLILALVDDEQDGETSEPGGPVAQDTDVSESGLVRDRSIWAIGGHQPFLIHQFFRREGATEFQLPDGVFVQGQGVNISLVPSPRHDIALFELSYGRGQDHREDIWRLPLDLRTPAQRLRSSEGVLEVWGLSHGNIVVYREVEESGTLIEYVDISTGDVSLLGEVRRPVHIVSRVDSRRFEGTGWFAINSEDGLDVWCLENRQHWHLQYDNIVLNNAIMSADGHLIYFQRPTQEAERDLEIPYPSYSAYSLQIQYGSGPTHIDDGIVSPRYHVSLEDDGLHIRYLTEFQGELECLYLDGFQVERQIVAFGDIYAGNQSSISGGGFVARLHRVKLDGTEHEDLGWFFADAGGRGVLEDFSRPCMNACGPELCQQLSSIVVPPLSECAGLVETFRHCVAVIQRGYREGFASCVGAGAPPPLEEFDELDEREQLYNSAMFGLMLMNTRTSIVDNLRAAIPEVVQIDPQGTVRYRGPDSEIHEMLFERDGCGWRLSVPWLTPS